MHADGSYVNACIFNLRVYRRVLSLDVLIFSSSDMDGFNQSCQCEKGYKKEGRNCVAIYGEVSVTGDDFLDISAIKKGRDMIFFQVCQTSFLYNSSLCCSHRANVI